MKRSELDIFVENIFSFTSPQILISYELEKFIIESMQCSELEAQEIIESYLPQVYKSINQKINNLKQEFVTPNYDVCNYDPDKLIRTSLFYKKDQREKIELKIKWRDKLKPELEKINWRQFEILSKFILDNNKISKIQVTQSTNDQGIDFYGYFDFSDLKFKNRFQNDLKLRIVGQVKHSEKKVKVNHYKISSFGTEINRLRKKEPPNYFRNLESSFFLSPLPLIGIFITNTFYLPKAIDFAQEYGIIVWNGNQIAEDLSSIDFLNLIIENDKISLDKFHNLLTEKDKSS